MIASLLFHRFRAVSSRTWLFFALLVLPAIAGGCGVAANGLNAEGTRYFQAGQQQAALESFRKALENDPRNADSYYNMGAVYHQMAKSSHDPSYYNQAEHYYHQCLDMDSNHVESYRGLAVLMSEQQRSDDALRLLEDWARRSPMSADAHVELARLHQEMGDNQKAEKQLLEAIAVNTRHSRARAALGKMREDAGDYTQALVNYNASLASNRVQPQIAARVAALTPVAQPQPMLAPVDGTRMVSAPPSSIR